MRLDFEKLYAIACSPNALEEHRRVARALRAAMNDWPADFEFVDEFVQALEASLGPLTYESTMAAASRMNIATDAWNVEALSELLEAWSNVNREKTLKELICSIQEATANE